MELKLYRQLIALSAKLRAEDKDNRASKELDKLISSYMID